MPDRRIADGAVLFDLDGTFLDTAPDMAYALNLLLESHGRLPLPFETVRPHVSHGAKALVRIGFGLEQERPAEAQSILEFEGGLILQDRDGMPLILLAQEGERYTWLDE